MEEVVVPTGTVKTCKAPVSSILTEFVLPTVSIASTQPTVSKCWRQNYDYTL